MVTLAQRIEALRTERGLSRPALAAELGLPKGAVEKFETGRQTPSREQQEKLAGYFGVSLFYLRGESNDRTRQETWRMPPGQDEPARPRRPPSRAAAGPAVPARRRDAGRPAGQQADPAAAALHRAGYASFSRGPGPACQPDPQRTGRRTVSGRAERRTFDGI